MFPTTNVLQYLERSAAAFPSKIAVADESAACSYEQLLCDARKIGSGLCKEFSACSPVPVFMEKSVETLKLFFGAVYAGCFYVLVNPEFPAPRVEAILETLETHRLVTTRSFAEKLPSLDGLDVLLLEDLLQTPEDAAALGKIRAQALDTDPLYANFTSGSTGTPKGVAVCHRSVIDFIEHFTELFSITGEDVIGNQAPFDFDVSVKDIYSAMKAGARLEIVPKALFSQPAKLLDHLCDRKITTMIWAVSALCLVTTFHGLEYKVPESVNKVLFSGEAMPMKHLKQWMEHLPESRFINLYGPTEITCNCTWHEVERGREYPDGLPIGRSFPNERVFLLDEDDHLVTEPGVHGEICVCGTALALGYYNNPAQTESRFVQNPLAAAYPQRMYRTGDLGWYNEQGELFFAGRKDFQIKYMGHRIELEEIERALSGVEGVERACCVFDEKKGRLTAYYVGEIEGKDIRHALSATLPVFMLPGAYVKLPEMPLNKNGKIDRKSLHR